jgi:hypothetical protein
VPGNTLLHSECDLKRPNRVDKDKSLNHHQPVDVLERVDIGGEIAIPLPWRKPCGRIRDRKDCGGELGADQIPRGPKRPMRGNKRKMTGAVGGVLNLKIPSSPQPQAGLGTGCQFCRRPDQGIARFEGTRPRVVVQLQTFPSPDQALSPQRTLHSTPIGKARSNDE